MIKTSSLSHLGNVSEFWFEQLPFFGSWRWIFNQLGAPKICTCYLAKEFDSLVSCYFHYFVTWEAKSRNLLSTLESLTKTHISEFLLRKWWNIKTILRYQYQWLKSWNLSKERKVHQNQLSLAFTSMILEAHSPPRIGQSWAFIFKAGSIWREIVI